MYNFFDSLEKMKTMIIKYVKLVVNNFNKWFLDLSIFNASKLFNLKHDHENAPQFLSFFFGLLQFQLQDDHYSITPALYV
jgi:hypothetical protein